MSTLVPASQNTVAEPGETPGPTPTPFVFQPTATEIIQAAASPTSAPDRLSPEKWREWPVVPAISQNAIEIYQRGLAAGHIPTHFSKLGDCQSVPASFLGIYDLPGRYRFAPEYRYLQETVDYYAGSFNRQGEAVRGGFNAASVISPLWADPKACSAGENPLECELRLHNPNILFISLEVWFPGRTPETLESYLRQIIEYSLSQNVLPVLATKADNSEGNHSLNYTVAKLAYEYDIPLWNFWRAVQPLPEHGIDWQRDSDGFHITVDAWNMRSFTALQVLDAIRRTAGAGAPAAASLEATPNATPAPLLPPPGLPDITISPAVERDNAAILFDLTTRDEAGTQLAGVFSASLDGYTLLPLTGAGTQLRAVSPDGQKVLVNRNNELYLIQIKDNKPQLLLQDFYWQATRGVDWLNNDEIVYIGQKGNETYLGKFSLKDDASISLPTPGASAVEVYPAPRSGRVYWGMSGAQGSGWTALDGSDSGLLPGVQNPVFSNTGNLASTTSGKKDTSLLLQVGGQSKSFPIPGNRVMDIAWSPDGSTLAVLSITSSNYSGLLKNTRLYLITWPGLMDKVYLPPDLLGERLAWSADGKALLVAGRVAQPGLYQLDFVKIGLPSQEIIPDAGFTISSEDYFNIPHLIWR